MENLNNLHNHDIVDDDEESTDDDEVATGAVTADQIRRDEVREVRKLSSKDTTRLRLWRIIVTGVLLLTAVAITFTTYILLTQQEDENFQTAVRFILSLYLSILEK
jgi:type VI protein secretion system component VasF